jgi:hypothetical protein
MQRWDSNKKIRKEKLLMIINAMAILIILINFGTISALRFSPKIEISDSSISYTFFFDYPLLTDVQMNNRTFTKIDLNDCFSYAQPGFPALPVYPAQLLLPQGALVADLHVTYKGLQEIPYDVLNKPILPEQEFVRVGMDENPSFVMNNTTYASPISVFENIYENGGIGYCRGFAILTVYLYPVQYIPKSGSLYYLPEMTVTIDLVQPEEDMLTENPTFLRYSEADKEKIQEIVTNPSIISTYAPSTERLLENDIETTGGEPQGGEALLGGYNNSVCDPAEHYQYVIITSASLKDTTGYDYNWTSLINHRRIFNGFNGTIVTVQEINACMAYWNSSAIFNDSPAHIREFCKDAYLNWGTEYILLGGDWDSTVSHQIVPYRLFTDREETESYNTMACDMYYSHLDGDWYYTAQGIWGGGRSSGVNDYYGELYIGRIAAYNASMVSNAVGKIIWYDLNASGDWLHQASFYGGDLGWASTSKQYMEELRLGTDTYRTFTGFEEWNVAHPESLFDTSERLYHTDLGSNYKTYFSNSIENDNASIINNLDHSDYTSPFGLTNWASRYNTKPFFGYSQGCLAGRFHAGYAGSEQLMCRHPERHAFALVLNTGYGYASSSNTNGPSQYLQCYFWDYFFNNQSNDLDNWRLGKARAYSQDIMSAKIDISSHAWCYAWYSVHLFGDPAQTLRLKDSMASDIVFGYENPCNGANDVPITTSTLNITIEQSQGQLFNYTIQTTPYIGSSTAQGESNGTKSCLVTGLNYSTTYHWFVNATDGTSWTNETYLFTTQAGPVNNPPLQSIPSPDNGSTNVSINTASLSITIQDPEGDEFNWTITTTLNVGSNSGTAASNGTKTCNLSSLSYSTTYTWMVNAYDGHHWINNTYWFTTESLDVSPPQISNITLRTSNPVDLQPGFSWENVTCSVTDNVHVNNVSLIITYPNSSLMNLTMIKKMGSSLYYYNTSFSPQGNFSYFIWANDTKNNHVTSTLNYFSLAPNWDITNDGICNMLDLTLISTHYSQINTPGWIREDVDNNGQINVFDLILISNHFNESWWE